MLKLLYLFYLFNIKRKFKLKCAKLFYLPFTFKTFSTHCSFLAVEALHLAHLMAAHGYLFPIDDHILTVKNDNTYYRFQVRAPYSVYHRRETVGYK